MTAANRRADTYQLATTHISLVDKDWGRLIASVGACVHEPEPAREPYEALIRAVAYQQLHARAAGAIVGRFLNMYPQSLFPSPELILATRPDDLRACGFSTRKISTIQGIAKGALRGLVPTREVANMMSDDELVARLVTLHGIGRWTVEMLLIYTLDRLDVLPADDFGVRAGYRLLKSLDTIPNRKEMQKAGLPCSPYRTVAAWYLWQISSLPGYSKKTETG
jgi:DNA-3-methyladenine glycosylase II